jgi:Na+/H+ antiporter NhaD/arsenite permease-like protein
MLLLIIFVLGYLCIAMEHFLKIDKAATAVTTGVLCWVIFALGYGGDMHELNEGLTLKLGEIGSILFFLLSAMTIVELIDTHRGFDIITSKIKTTDPYKLLVMVSIITFFLSSILDNLTTAIVMAALIKKLIKDKEMMWIFGGFVIIAANAGGAFSPIGDVTTIMLWIGGQITSGVVISKVILPSIICLAVPLGMAYFSFRKNNLTLTSEPEGESTISKNEQITMLIIGVLGLVSVPIFKTYTHLPPFMGILLSLGVIWIFTEILHRKKVEDRHKSLKVTEVLRKVDTPSVLFFLGILLAVGALEKAGFLTELANTLNTKVGNIYVINTLIGLLSSIVDNVPLVAAAMGMYTTDIYHVDHNFWTFLSYTAGTGGSVLIIGSAAGVAIMGLLKIDFIWYLKKISFYALAGYLAGVGLYILLNV